MDYSDSQSSYPSNTKSLFLIYFSSTRRNSSTEALMEEIKLVVSEKYDFQNRVNSAKRTLFIFCDCWDFMQKTSRTFTQSIRYLRGKFPSLRPR